MKNRNGNIGRNWVWGIFFVCAAAVAILYQLGIFTVSGVGPIGIIITILLLMVIAGSIKHLNFFGITFPAAIILMIFSDHIGKLKDLVPWGLLGVALLLAIGLTILFKPLKWFRWKWNINCGAGRNFSENHCHRHFKGNVREDYIAGTNEEIGGDEIEINSSFTGCTRYIKSENLKRVFINCSFGAAKVFFNDARLNPEGAEVIIDSSFSGVELYIPKEWRVNNNISAVLGGVDEKNKDNNAVGPLLNLNGNTKLGGVEIVYV